ncbi:MAG: 30S ribosomal protein S21 [Halobacteriovoraceae bacterium]|nr:30S ribosomal protein S21 [Halobacteriovoraceae bacterium]
MSNDSVKVVVSGSFTADKALRKFKRMCESAGILKEYRKRKEYKKPSMRKKEKLQASEKRRAKENTKSFRRSKI